MLEMCALLRAAVLIVALFSVEAFAPPCDRVRSGGIKASSTCLSAMANPLKRRSKKKTNVLRVESIEEYKEKVVDEKECITVVRFYSQYCKSCQASEPHFYKLASDFRNISQNDTAMRGIKVNFVEVPLLKHTHVLHEALDIPSLPWTHIYHPIAGLVEECAVSKKHIDDVRACLRCYVYGECDLDDAPADCMNVYGECAVE